MAIAANGVDQFRPLLVIMIQRRLPAGASRIFLDADRRREGCRALARQDFLEVTGATVVTDLVDMIPRSATAASHRSRSYLSG